MSLNQTPRFISRGLVLSAAVALAAISGCGDGNEGRPDEELGELVVSSIEEVAPIDVELAAKSAAELGRALAVPHGDVSVAFGPHRVKGASSLEVREGDEVIESLTDEIAIFVDSAGDFSATLDNSRDYGRHVYFIDGKLLLRPRYGDYHRRAPVDEGEPARIRQEIYGAVGAYFELLLPRAEISDEGERTVAGRPGRVIAVSTAAEASPRPAAALAQRAWREGAEVKEVSGEVVLDTETGAPLAAKIAGTVTFSRDGRSFTLRVTAEHEVSAIGTADLVEAPADDAIADIPLRRSELDERDELLEGIAPPARAAPTPANPSGTASVENP